MRFPVRARSRGALAALVAATLVVVAVGPCGDALGYDDASWEAARGFDRFLDDHPWVARDLQRDPTLANDPGYLEDHRSLREFLDDHPAVRRELHRDPYAVLRREHRMEREERREREITREEMQRFDRFLHDHPGVAHDLRSDPPLVNSRSYLGDHPGFRDFLRDHPAIRQELQGNPYAFMRRWERYGHREEHPGKKRAGHR
jgi:phage-related protein